MSADPGVLVGQVLASRYRLEEHLGRGAMGDVYRARHAKVPRAFAVKVLLPHFVRDPKVIARFEREAELAGRLRHRNVTSVIDVGETDGTRFLVMDFAEGTDLGALMAEGVLDPRRAIALFRQILDGIEHAHAHDVVHRDLKPENVIVEQSGDEEIARIVDFGVAILRDGGSSKGDRLTTGGLVIGTPHYMAPELATGRAFDHRIDLFALGVILYELLTGVMPFEGTGVDVALKNLKVPTPPMSQRAPGVMVDPLLEALTHKLMEKRAENRPQSARAVREILDRIAHDRAEAAVLLGVALEPRIAIGSTPPPIADPTPATTPVPDDRSTRELLAAANQRSRWVTRIATAALLLGVTAIGLSIFGRGQASASVELDMASETHLAPTPERATTKDTAPPTSLAVAKATTVLPAPVVGPGPVITTPAPKTQQLPEASPADARSVIAKYQAVARQLKSIADKRDMSADDLWQRYRLIRIQDAIADSGKRAEVMNELMQIDREIERRFKLPL
ncbi:MAG: serine/threonine protein kinase [Deltaproteobacteria bacterium]|nr:serine/threonine protein kinase [Deltaproteobacteria bacterium]